MLAAHATVPVHLKTGGSRPEPVVHRICDESPLLTQAADWVGAVTNAP